MTKVLEFILSLCILNTLFLCLIIYTLIKENRKYRLDNKALIEILQELNNKE